MTDPSLAPPAIDTSKPHPARVYDWYLGGKDNYPVDEALARQITTMEPSARYGARHNRWFMHRATRMLAARLGVRQFLDIGTGIPTEPNLHRVAQTAAPETSVVYVDNDPIVLAHAAALLRGTPEGVTRYLQADAREPRKILELAGTILDFDRPVAVSLIALLHFIPDEQGAYDIIRTLVDALPSGSYLVLSQLASDYDPERTKQAVDMYAAGGVTLVPRSREEMTKFFAGLELLDPGVVWLPDWHPELAVDEERDGTAVPLYAGVARKP
ncbi:SAM-dependent methyltransferase [Streptomyces kunmingensis]|uniref:SAM-dependent methyltransferase n=1 Tax=Streptomyces kunmingensis TaxID=68225 RepID=A0ABU6C9P9_9ACTN|nr:SAM-dependent methyltransferase [Streptomyces kunmingensis]MEB3961434.1 SAM-dependent methyltransferase [Streptomyces kunmingensis]